MTSVLLVAGTRPEAIKLAPLYRELRRARHTTVSFCSAGQHREMLASVLDFFGIRPDVTIDAMRPGQSLAALGARLLRQLDQVYADLRPGVVVVQGDTTTTMTAALAACYREIPVAHVEAGLRSFDRAPFPEEVNRRVTTRCCDYHFAPTETARRHLMDEGIGAERIWVVGNTVVDALVHARAIVHGVDPAAVDARLAAIDFRKPIVLVTAHRRENLGSALERICAALRQIARLHDVEIVYPVHPNPRIGDAVSAALGSCANVHLLPPLPYPAMVLLMERARVILTDSGGMQEEAPALGTPVLVLREVTERLESVACGAARLVGTCTSRIVSEASRLLSDAAAHQAMASAGNPYGAGDAAGRISQVLERLSDPGDHCSRQDSMNSVMAR
jgi:UDP-N-acetylglucosamine 2-epimerase (non-hydrolysing)